MVVKAIAQHYDTFIRPGLVQYDLLGNDNG